MVQVDVNKCFDSIYTHSLPWAILGKSQVKFQLRQSMSTFAGKFDELMQSMNYQETNGIVIGPEFSRLFAEIILQSIDLELEMLLKEKENLIHKVDYEIFRYVDDYFIFFNDAAVQAKVVEMLQIVLKSKKLSINPAKMKLYSKPIITEITIAKESVSALLSSAIEPKVEEKTNEDPNKPPVQRVGCRVNSNRLIVQYKTVIKQSGVEYGDLLNYTFAIIENKIEKLLKAYLESDKTDRDRKILIEALLAIIEFSFFAYSASPKVNHTIRLCRMVSTSVDFLNANAVPYELKHLLFKYVHDNIMQQLEKNIMGTHREIESLYLLISLSQVGKEYWLPLSTLTKHFRITENGATNAFERHGPMNHFSVTVLLSYIKDKVRYKKLREFIESHTLANLEHTKAQGLHNTESMLLFLDLIVCPYISSATKLALAGIFGLNASDLREIQATNDHWFTAWGDKFNLGKELDAKRGRDVY